MALVYFIDDEQFASKLYRTAIERYHQVKYIKTIDNIDSLVDSIVHDGPAVIVQDVMMTLQDSGTIDIAAGMLIARRIRETLVKLKIPLVLFTNRMVRELQADCESLKYPKHQLHLLFKPDMSPTRFSLLICDLVDSKWEIRR
jgi:hypothetical protein